MSNSVGEIDHTDCLLIFGYNPAASHPIVAKHVVAAKANGAKIIVVDPRVIETARIADMHLQLKNGSNMWLVNAFANVMITEGMLDDDYVQNRVDHWEEYKAEILKYTPEVAAEHTGIDAETIRKAAHMYGEAKTATILWGMGVTQWGEGVNVVKGLASLAVITGNIGRPNTGTNPVRGQNNVQGSCDIGCLPNIFPGYQSVLDPDVVAKFAKRWGKKPEEMSDHVGYFLTDLPHLVKEGKVRAFWCMGEDPAHTEPDLSEEREMLENIEFMVSSDIFMTETATYADVIFPASSWGEHECVFSSCDRGFQRSYAALPPFGDSKHDWQIISEVATAMGYPMHYNNTKEIWDELRELCPKFAGATYEKMEDLGMVRWPCPTEDHPGTQYLFADKVFATKNGKAQLFVAEPIPPFEKPDETYPLVLCTVREVGHYSCRSMTGNCRALTDLADEPGYMTINPVDAQARGISQNQLMWAYSRRGKILVRAEVSDRANPGAVYMSYQWWVGACNELTIHHVSEGAKTPEFKHCAIQVEAIPDQVWAERYLAESYAKVKERLSRAASAQDRDELVAQSPEAAQIAGFMGQATQEQCSATSCTPTAV